MCPTGWTGNGDIMTRFAYSIDEEVTVEYPNGSIKDGIVERRRTISGNRKRYTISFRNGAEAATFIPEHWICLKGQLKLI